MRLIYLPVLCGLSLFLGACTDNTAHAAKEELKELDACKDTLKPLTIPDTRDQRFLGKVTTNTALCRGGEAAKANSSAPWVDWAKYWGAGDNSSLPKGIPPEAPKLRGVTGALLDLEYQRVELIKFNLFDNNGIYKTYVQGKNGVDGRAVKVWPEMRLPNTNPYFQKAGGDQAQVCKGDLIRGRTITGICNDILNPLMGSIGTPFARNVEFETSFPDQGLNQLTKNRHGNRLGLLTPDPQVISRTLLTRVQPPTAKGCNGGFGAPDNSADADCDYQKAPFFNVLAAYWIQFMTHDWFSHMDEGHNATLYIDTGCETKLVNGVSTPLTPDDVQKLGCRPGDRVDKTLVAKDSTPESFTANGRTYLARAPKTFANNNTAWWDASQLYGYDENSIKRVKRDPKDPALLLLEPVQGAPGSYLPVFEAGDPIQKQWSGQEAAGFPDNWTIGMSFYHNLFAREHNSFVAEFRKEAAARPEGDSGLRNPDNPTKLIANKDVTPDELFTAARLVVSASIAKIHTIEWTPQLLYDEPLYKGMNANWNGLLGEGQPDVTAALSNLVAHEFGTSTNGAKATTWYSIFASGPGILGIGSDAKGYDMSKPEFTNGGVNHFGSPFNFPEEFVTVYRLHSLLPDLIEYRDVTKDPNRIEQKVAIISTFEAKATDAMHSRGLANWGLSMGRQRLGLLTLHNTPQFMQSITLPRLDTSGKQLDLAALDLIRDREHGVPRFNEFRRQYGLRQLTSFDDFFPQPLAGQYTQWAQQLRDVYGTHVCDASKVITDAQRDKNNNPINDCLGHKDGSVIDNIEDVDTVVGWLSESVRPHGFAISETQFVVFILNASRRLYSDRFFTSSFRPEFYTTLGINWVKHNGPGAEQMEEGMPNGHRQPVSPLKRVLLRNIPELAGELKSVVNVFDPWARARGEYYSLDWQPRQGAESDPAFAIRTGNPPVQTSRVSPGSISITILYTILLLWGAWVGVRQVYQGFFKPNELLNPLFADRNAIKIFTFHLIVVSLDLWVCGPWAVAHKSTLWYWGGRIALLSSSFPLAAYFNRNPQSFGKLIGYWVRFRNFFEISLHVLVAALAVNWFNYYGLLYWIVAYRYLDVGPRRALQKLYNTPEKNAARPWAPILNWVVITTIYILTAIAIYNQKVIYAAPPPEALDAHIPAVWEGIVVLGLNVGVALTAWNMMRKYTGQGPAVAASAAAAGR